MLLDEGVVATPTLEPKLNPENGLGGAAAAGFAAAGASPDVEEFAMSSPLDPEWGWEENADEEAVVDVSCFLPKNEGDDELLDPNANVGVALTGEVDPEVKVAGAGAGGFTEAVPKDIDDPVDAEAGAAGFANEKPANGEAAGVAAGAEPVDGVVDAPKENVGAAGFEAAGVALEAPKEKEGVEEEGAGAGAPKLKPPNAGDGAEAEAAGAAAWTSDLETRSCSKPAGSYLGDTRCCTEASPFRHTANSEILSICWSLASRSRRRDSRSSCYWC